MKGRPFDNLDHDERQLGDDETALIKPIPVWQTFFLRTEGLQVQNPVERAGVFRVLPTMRAQRLW